MPAFATKTISDAPDEIAPDGSEVRVLLATERTSTAQFRLIPGATARAMRHRTVDEIWFVTAGHGELWRRQDGREEVVVLEPGVSASLPLGTEFQFRSLGPEPLLIVGATTPPWPGDDEGVFVDGPWVADV